MSDLTQCCRRRRYTQPYSYQSAAEAARSFWLAASPVVGGGAWRGGTEGRRRGTGVAGMLRAPGAGGTGLAEYGREPG